MTVKLGVAVVALLMTIGCATSLPPIRLAGTPADMQRLAGEWVGNYTSDDVDGRSGSITFILEAGEDVAHGDVLMTPRGARVPYGRHDPDQPFPGRVLGVPSESLTIRFVRAEDGAVSGELDAYWDPDRRCQARTVFRGALKGDEVTGTYHTTFSAPMAKVTGRWTASRVAK